MPDFFFADASLLFEKHLKKLKFALLKIKEFFDKSKW